MCFISFYLLYIYIHMLLNMSLYMFYMFVFQIRNLRKSRNWVCSQIVMSYRMCLNAYAAIYFVFYFLRHIFLLFVDSASSLSHATNMCCKQLHRRPPRKAVRSVFLKSFFKGHPDSKLQELRVKESASSSIIVLGHEKSSRNVVTSAFYIASLT